MDEVFSSAYDDFIRMLNESGISRGLTGDAWTKAVKYLANKWGVDDLTANSVANSMNAAANRQINAVTGGYSDADVMGKANSVMRGMNVSSKPMQNAYAKFMAQLQRGMGPALEDMGNRANAVSGMGDLAARGMGSAMASYGDPNDAVVQFLRYLGGGGQAPGRVVD